MPDCLPLFLFDMNLTHKMRLACWLAPLFLATPTWGQTAAKAKKPPASAPVATATLGGGKVQGKVLTRDELRSCLKRQADLGLHKQAYEKQATAMKDEKAQLVAAGDALATDLAALDRTSAEAVAAYNAKAHERDAKVDDWNARNMSFNADGQALQAEQDGWNTECSNRPYREDDEAAIRRGK